MSGVILEPDEAQKIITEYVCQRERASNNDIRIESFEPSMWGGAPVYLFRGKTHKQTVNPTTWEAGVLEVHAFLIWITANDGKIIGYKPSDPGHNGGQQVHNPAISNDPRDEELKQSEIYRNQAEAEYLEEKMNRDMQRDIQENKNNFGINPNRFEIDNNRFKI